MGDERVKEEAIQIIGVFQLLPKLVVFDLDFTLWPFCWARCSISEDPSQVVALVSRVRKVNIKKATDNKAACLCILLTVSISSDVETPSLYPHTNGILYALKEKGIDVAIASRSPTAAIAKTFLNKLGISSMFVAQEIYFSWSPKTEHIERIHRKTSIPYTEMLFFDDEDRNTEAVEQMGVTSILVANGVDQQAFRQGLTEFSLKSSASSKAGSSDAE